MSGGLERRVAVIGAGPAGAITVDALVKEGVFDTIRVFERQSVPGGTWVFTRNGNETPRIPSLQALLDGCANDAIPIPSTMPCEQVRTESVDSRHVRFSDTAAHEHLHSNLPPEIMCFTQEPIPRVVSDRTRAEFGADSPFRHREVMQQWVKGILKRGDYERLVSYDTTVELANKQGDEWVLTLRKSIPGELADHWWEERFDAIVVAVGHYSVPFVPRIPGLVEFGDKRPGSVQHSKHYVRAEQYRDQKVIVVGGAVSAFDTLHDIRKVSQLPVISSLRKPSRVYGAAPFTHPHISNRPAIASIAADTGRITFTDGSCADNVDVILFATGYEFSFPFLPQIKPKNGRVPGLYQHVFCSHDPSLAFIGMVTGSFGLRIFEWQAVAAARVLAGRANLPSLDDMNQWEALRLAERGDGPAFWTLVPEFERYYEDLRRIAGDPAPGSGGRLLPRYDSDWGRWFWRFVEYRVDHWQKEAAVARVEANKLMQPKI